MEKRLIQNLKKAILLLLLAIMFSPLVMAETTFYEGEEYFIIQNPAQESGGSSGSLYSASSGETNKSIRGELIDMYGKGSDNLGWFLIGILLVIMAYFYLSRKGRKA